MGLLILNADFFIDGGAFRFGDFSRGFLGVVLGVGGGAGDFLGGNAGDCGGGFVVVAIVRDAL